jgi:oligoribonuclease (3'-5' exoribonuclease)
MLEKEEGIIAKRKSLVKEIAKLKKAYLTIRDKSEKHNAVAKITEKQKELAQIREEFIDEQTRNRK